jgi:hypothetical protein
MTSHADINFNFIQLEFDNLLITHWLRFLLLKKDRSVLRKIIYTNNELVIFFPQMMNQEVILLDLKITR